jgi:metallophosphoesterase (TIGR00282 family)
LRILFLADVVGTPGRKALEERLPSLREELDIDVCVANGENVADGVGITPKLADKLLASGVDAITLGNHTFRRMEIAPYLSGSDRVLRPANFTSHTPGKGLCVVPARDGTPVAVINVIGSLFLQTPISLWEQIDELVEEAQRRAKVIIVDVHAEAKSEKVALAHWLAGKVTLVVGTHTHVQTNDARVIPGGTAAVSDAGMTGPHDSVIGVQKELAIKRMRTGLPVRFETASGDVRIEGVLVECDADGRATSCETIRVSVG